MQRDELGSRKVDPYQLLFQGGQFYLVGRAHERDAIRVFRLSRIRGKVAYASKAEHDFQRPEDFDPRAYANRIQWQFGEPVGTAEVRIGEKIGWQIERHFGRYGEMRPADGRGRRAAIASSRPSTPTPGSSSRGCSGSASTRACSGRPSWSRSWRSGSACSSSATAASWSWRRGRARRGRRDAPAEAAESQRPRRGGGDEPPRSAPSASRGSSRSRRS